MKDVLTLESNKMVRNIKIGHIEINLLSGVIKTNTPQFKLDRVGRKEAKLLELLFDNENDIVSKFSLLDLVWGEQVVTENSLAVAMFNLRTFLKKYDEKNKYRLINVSGYGYGLYSDHLL
ncbi:hypothetical protein FR932_01150 [Moritella marina ATCC 15381]|uniref:OmpR/PhoB-type domain-containing protein n=1 Tax=Moritella marina ATCC 15381 TaxID=1202962 RepID=A0A5J6WF71_MORMI|nr:winged helix-turn-helix domain-containing protein [Moritella marina]QFI36529.1 hypothetical protein FR932_01150 [Moritella marina ATCC 15381]